MQSMSGLSYHISNTCSSPVSRHSKQSNETVQKNVCGSRYSQAHAACSKGVWSLPVHSTKMSARSCHALSDVRVWLHVATVQATLHMHALLFKVEPIHLAHTVEALILKVF
jgi:hypothetical protein